MSSLRKQMSTTALRNKSSTHTLRGRTSFATLRRQDSSSSLTESGTPVSEKITELLDDDVLGVFAWPWMFRENLDDDPINRAWLEKRAHGLRPHGMRLYFWFRELRYRIGPMETSKPLVNLLSGIIEETRGLCSLYINAAQTYEGPKSVFEFLDSRPTHLALFTPSRVAPFDFEPTRQHIYLLIGQFKPPLESSSSSSSSPQPPLVVHRWLGVPPEKRMEKYWKNLCEKGTEFTEDHYEARRIALVKQNFRRTEDGPGYLDQGPCGFEATMAKLRWSAYYD